MPAVPPFPAPLLRSQSESWLGALLHGELLNGRFFLECATTRKPVWPRPGRVMCFYDARCAPHLPFFFFFMSRLQW